MTNFKQNSIKKIIEKFYLKMIFWFELYGNINKKPYV